MAWCLSGTAVVLSLALTACGGSSRETAPLPGASPSPAPVAARVLVVSYTTGFRHSSIDVGEPVLEMLGRTSGVFTTVPCRTAEDVQRWLTPAGLAGVDALFFLNTTGNLGVPDLNAMLAWVAAGHGFAGVHSAADTYHDAPAYLAMLGNEFLTHGDQAQVQAVVEAPQHPAVAHLAPRYEVFDEIYRFVRNNRDDVMPLLTLDHYPQDGLRLAGAAGDLPLAWARLYGAGRVFYTALGHRDELWRDPVYQQHVLGGLRWALGR